MAGISLLPKSAWAATTEHQSLGVINNRHLFFIVLDAGKSEIRLPDWWGSGERSLLSWQMVDLLAVSSHDGGKALLCCASYIRILIPFMRPDPYDLITSQMSHLQIPPHNGLGL